MRSNNKTKQTGFILFICGLFATATGAEPLPMQAIAETWNFYGEGSHAFQNRMLYMEESEGSKGVMIVSPEAFAGDITLRYEIMPMTASSVCVAILHASDAGEAGTLTMPEGYDGSMGHWINQVDNYFFAFHNAAHDRTPFGIRFPSQLSVGEHTENIMRNGEFYSIEVGRKGEKLWFSVNGKRLYEGKDPNPLQSGRIAFRIRGIPQQPAACLIRNVSVE